MNMMLRVFVAGPISSGDLQHNIQQAKLVTVWLIEHGYVPIVPHLFMYLEDNTPRTNPFEIPNEVWYPLSLSLLACADLVLRLPGPSAGADAEVEWAIKHGLPVYYSALALPPSFIEASANGPSDSTGKPYE